MAENELMHYGVLGQKWGVRRYQNEDGSLTPLGREHYGLHNLSEIQGPLHTDKANKNAVKEKDKLYKNINKREKRDLAEIGLEAARKYGVEDSEKKAKWIADQRVKAANAAYEAKLEVDRYLKWKYADMSVGDIVNDDVARGKKAVAKSEAQTNRILALFGITALTIGSVALIKRKKKASGGS